MGWLTDMLGAAGDALSAPGDYTRGLLAGRPGDRVGARDLLSGYGLADQNDDSWLGAARDFGVGVLTDPLTYAGGALGGLASRGAYKMLGPMHGGGASKLEAALAAGGRPAQMAEELAASPVAGKVLGEIPQGSSLLEGSNNALAFKTPQGDVLRLAAGKGGQAPQSRAAIEEMLQPTRNVVHGDYRVERVPWAEGVGDKKVYADAYQDLTGGVRAQGFHPADVHPGNVGTYGGNPVIIDPGAVVPHPRAAGPLPFAEDAIGATPFRFMGPGAGGGASLPSLLRALGGYGN